MPDRRSPEFRAFMQAVRASAAERAAASRTLAGIRATIDSFAGSYPLPDDVRVTPVDCDGVPAEWVEAAAADRVVLYAHGGCYVSGSPAVVREFCARLATASGCRVLSVDYRLAPEHPFPAALDDVLAAYRWLVGRGVPPTRIAVAGESAGGGLVFAALIACRDRGLAPPACGVALSPWVDLEVSYGASLVTNADRDMATADPLVLGARAYAGADPRNPLASPLHADLAGLPPLLVQVGTAELLRDEGLEIAARARRAGCDVTVEPWEDMVHVWHWFGSVFPEARAAIESVGAYLRAHLA
ncbi:MAG: alpha/beta hydrolase [Gammaproteobacteria bacterium]|nr:alpha/beta hydrolase [Gammaproteobacteria bacterium]